MSDAPSKLKMKVAIEGCPYEDGSTIRTFTNALKLHSVLWDVDQELRSRMKYEEISESEYDYLEKIRGMIHEEGVLNDE